LSPGGSGYFTCIQNMKLASSPASKVKTAVHTYTANTHKMTTVHTRQLQQYTKTTNNNIHKTTNNTHKTTNNNTHKTS